MVFGGDINLPGLRPGGSEPQADAYETIPMIPAALHLGRLWTTRPARP